MTVQSLNKKNYLFGFLLFVSFLLRLDGVYAGENAGRLTLKIVDAKTEIETSARLEVIDSHGNYYVAGDALLAGGDCNLSNALGDRDYDLKASLSKLRKKIFNRYTDSTQFYSTGESTVKNILGNTTVTIKVFKGPEFEVEVADVFIPEGGVVNKTIVLKRWADMPEKGWYSSDDHLHIARSVKELNPFVSRLMQAEDIHVGNLLQMGKADYVSIAPQYAYGVEGLYQEHQHILASGQENPRTHILGHAITLGANEFLHLPEHYIIYRLLWQQAVDQGAINGAAHWGSGVGAKFGLPVLLPHHLMHFMEVINHNYSDYQTWYEVLNLGFRVTPTAGTDYPCGGEIPGRERFYTKVEGELSYAQWLEGVRKGRTFVTTGPLIEFSINGKGMGADIHLESSGSVQVEGRVRFNTDTDNLAGLELVENGNVIRSFPRLSDKGEISFSIDHHVTKNSWLALRGFTDSPSLDVVFNEGHISMVHSGVIYISLKDAPPITDSDHSKAIARTWLSRLIDLEKRLEESSIEYLVKQFMFASTAEYDAVPERIVVNNRDALLNEVREAKVFFSKLIDE